MLPPKNLILTFLGECRGLPNTGLFLRVEELLTEMSQFTG